MMLEGWGRYPRHESLTLDCRAPNALADSIGPLTGVIARGNGRSYGDAAIGEGATVMCSGLSRMKAFDPETSLLTVEGGAMLSDILEAFVPRGYFPPVVPGTKLVTVGGMIACDVHGKNHHRDGGFGNHLTEFKLLVASGDTITCSRQQNAELFFATIGGMGLTGIIVEATFPMKPVETGWVLQKTTVASNLAEALGALEASAGATYSVAWIDCLARGASLGRSLVFAGEHATRERVSAQNTRGDLFPAWKPTSRGLPLDLPGWALNKAAVSLFNEVYFRGGARKAGSASLVHWNRYFFPLDDIDQWNRLYGKRGFLQHQCVVPDGAVDVLSDILERFARSGKGSFLAVLKKMGRGAGLLSFPKPGYTLAVDLPLTHDVFPLLEEIDRSVVQAGGRLYLAKDARQSRETFEAGYPQLREFQELRRAMGAEARFNSRLAKRLGI